MKHIFSLVSVAFFLFASVLVNANSDLNQLPSRAQKIMTKPRYQHANWGIYTKDLATGEVLYQLNPEVLFIPASLSKLVTVAALLHDYGDDYTFKTPVYALGEIDGQGTLNGNIVVVASGDLVLGGRAVSGNKIAVTNFDHSDANLLPGAILTPQDPLAGIKSLAKQIKNNGVLSINGDVIIDTHLFATYTKRENVISPIMINENLIDFVVTPTTPGQTANITFRPQLQNMKVVNKVTTVAESNQSTTSIKGNPTGDIFEVSGTVSTDTVNIVNTYPIEDPKEFARLALIEALQQEGITIRANHSRSVNLSDNQYSKLKPIAILTSAPLSEYAKLILKVSHNMGANLIPALLAARHGKTEFQDGMKYIGEFLKNTVHIMPAEVSFGDAAGGNDNYITPKAMLKLLEYTYHLPAKEFNHFVYALPIMGVDGSLASVAKHTSSQGHVFAKTGTGITYNMLFDKYLLTAKGLAGFYQAKNQHWIAFFIVVNQGDLQTVQEVFEVNNDLGLVADALYGNLGA